MEFEMLQKRAFLPGKNDRTRTRPARSFITNGLHSSICLLMTARARAGRGTGKLSECDGLVKDSLFGMGRFLPSNERIFPSPLSHNFIFIFY